MEIERRAFLRCAAATALTLLGPTIARAQSGELRFLNACRLADGRYAVAEFDPEGVVIRTIPLPDRGHGFALSPDGRLAVAFARHPRTFGVAFTVGGGGEPVLFAAPDDRHFYGHGAFVSGGRLLLATENDFDNARGVIGIYDVGRGFARIGEIDVNGVGPHELIALRNDRTIAVAVGGIETHPAAGDAKLNLATMSPSLAFIDTEHAEIIAEHRVDQSLHQLSIRHLALDQDGAVWFGCQYEGPADDSPSLIGRATPGAGPMMVAEPADIRLSLDNYVGSVAALAGGELIAASSPRGGRIVIFDRTGRLVHVETLADGCGLAADAGNGLMATSGGGAIVAIDPRSGSGGRVVASTDIAFDNHTLALRPGLR